MKANCTVDPQKPNLTQQFIRTSRIPSKEWSQNLFKRSNNWTQSYTQKFGHLSWRGGTL